MNSEGVFANVKADQREVVDALTSSLQMMTKVLNDVLDFNRMSEGRLISVHRPFFVHKVVRSIIIAVKVAAEKRRLNVHVDLDERIDALSEPLLGYLIFMFHLLMKSV